MNSIANVEEVDFLLIGGGFFGYATEIRRKLEERGRKVAVFEDRPALDTLTKATIRLAPSLVASRAKAHVESIISQMRGHAIRDVLIIKGESLSPALFRMLRVAFPEARITLYFWDSYQNMPRDSNGKVDVVDRAFTFDPIDAESDHRLTYRPLFFLDEYADLPKTCSDIDLLFFGTAHSDRYEVLNRLTRGLSPDIRMERVLYLPSKWVYAAKRLFRPGYWRARREEFIFTPLAKADVQSLISRARVVIDIERVIQCGFTMRTIEMLGAGKKLVTTNGRVTEADFYDPRNIAVIDRRTPQITPEFLQYDYVQPEPSLLRRYSLSGWLDEVVSPRKNDV